MEGLAVFGEFGEGGGVDFDEGEVAVGGDGETDATDAGVEVEDFWSGDVGFDEGEGAFVEGEIDLEEATGGVGKGGAEEGVGEGREVGVGAVIFEEATGDGAGLVGAEEEGLELAGVAVLSVEFGDDFSGGGENGGEFEAGGGDGDFAVGAAEVEAGVDFLGGVVEEEGIFHFVAVEEVLVVGDGEGDWGVV